MTLDAKCVWARFKLYGTYHVIVIDNGKITHASTEQGSTEENPWYVPVCAVLPMPEMYALDNWEVYSAR